MAIPRICVVASTPSIIYFFLQDHISKLAEFAEVTVIYGEDAQFRLEPSGLSVRSMRVQINRQITPWPDLKALVALWWLFRREQFDLVWAVGPKAGLIGMLAAWFARIKLRLFIFQGEVWASRKGFMRHLLKSADRTTACCATHLLAVSLTERDFLEQEGVVRKGRLGVLGEGSISGVEIERFAADQETRNSMRRSMGIPQSAVVGIYLGRLNADKGIMELARAFLQVASENPDAWLLWVGQDEGNWSEQIEACLAPVRDRVRMLGFSDQPEQYMAASDYICLPSYREGFPISILEAAAMGLPAIGSRIYGVRDAIVEAETGLLFEVRDVSALADAIAKYCQDRNLRVRHGLNAYQRVVRDFVRDTVVERYISFIHEACLTDKAEALTRQ